VVELLLEQGAYKSGHLGVAVAGYTVTDQLVAVALGLDAQQALLPVDHLLEAPAEALPAIVVRAPLSRYRLGVALAGSRVGDNAWLASIAQSAGAACANAKATTANRLQANPNQITHRVVA